LRIAQYNDKRIFPKAADEVHLINDKASKGPDILAGLRKCRSDRFAITIAFHSTARGFWRLRLETSPRTCLLIPA